MLVLLIASAIQVFWWILDQTRKAEDLRQRLTQLYNQDAAAARELHARGASPTEISELYPHLDVGSDGQIAVDESVLDELSEDRSRWLNQYGWEGSFFLLVLAISMAAVWRALREEAILRRRQQNFVAAVSHELKSPLASMQLTVETLRMREPPREKTRELLQRLSEDIERMMDMITKILDSSNLDQHGIKLRPETVELLPAIHQSLEQLRHLRDRSSATVDIEVNPDLVVFADPIGVGTVVRNLLDNAFHAVTDQGGGSVWIEAKSVKGFVQLAVRDDGVGFDPAESSRLFDKFYRPGNELRRKGSGQGLGLYIVRRFVELEKGRVHASSEGIGRGATFEVWWPEAREAAA
jgi:signal transduction histidine kinase